MTRLLKGLHPDPAAAARELLDQFAPVVSIERAHAGKTRLQAVPPERWALGMIIARCIVRRGLQFVPKAQRWRGLDSPLRDRAVQSLRGAATERMVAIFADAQGRILAQDLVAEGTRGQMRLSMRRVFTKALARDTRHMILAHNHPSGCAEPSESDIVSTARFQTYARSLGIALEDHLIVGSDTITSMRARGLLQAV